VNKPNQNPAPRISLARDTRSLRPRNTPLHLSTVTHPKARAATIGVDELDTGFLKGRPPVVSKAAGNAEHAKMGCFAEMAASLFVRPTKYR
jgi:hypothetical protein